MQVFELFQLIFDICADSICLLHLVVALGNLQSTCQKTPFIKMTPAIHCFAAAWPNACKMDG